MALIRDFPSIDTTCSATGYNNAHLNEIRVSFALTDQQKTFDPTNGYCPINISDFYKFLTKGFIWISDKGIALVHRNIFMNWCKANFESRLKLTLQFQNSGPPLVWTKNSDPTTLEEDHPFDSNLDKPQVILVRHPSLYFS